MRSVALEAGRNSTMQRRPSFMSLSTMLLCCGASAAMVAAEPAATSSPLTWPELTDTARPWAYWWWQGSAVDPENLQRELQRYQDAGMGGVHIIPIYGAKGYEARYLEYLSPKWMEMLACAGTEAGRRGLGVDMTTGTG
jgi:hypothetical protein